MHQGNWTCSSCGGTISELPFEPRRTDGLLCRDCHSKQKSSGDRSARPEGGQNQGERKMFTGDWKCAECGEAITELPFQPRETNNLKCRNCFRK